MSSERFTQHQRKAGSAKTPRKKASSIANLGIKPAECACKRTDGTHAWNCPIQRKIYRERVAAKKLQNNP